MLSNVDQIALTVCKPRRVELKPIPRAHSTLPVQYRRFHIAVAEPLLVHSPKRRVHMYIQPGESGGADECASKNVDTPVMHRFARYCPDPEMKSGYQCPACGTGEFVRIVEIRELDQ